MHSSAPQYLGLTPICLNTLWLPPVCPWGTASPLVLPASCSADGMSWLACWLLQGRQPGSQPLG
jgi:hypothetical protein